MGHTSIRPSIRHIMPFQALSSRSLANPTLKSAHATNRPRQPLTLEAPQEQEEAILTDPDVLCGDFAALVQVIEAAEDAAVHQALDLLGGACRQGQRVQ